MSANKEQEQDNISQIGSTSDTESESQDGQQSIREIIESEPLYYVLGQFLQSSNNKNITTIFEEFVVEIKKMNQTLSKIQSVVETKSAT